MKRQKKTTVVIAQHDVDYAYLYTIHNMTEANDIISQNLNIIFDWTNFLLAIGEC